MLTTDELGDNVGLLFVAGHETTVNLIGNGTLALLRNRDQLEALQADPSLDTNAVDELLRYDSPVQFSRRIVTKPLTVGDATIDPGKFVMTCLGSANRDPDMFGADAAELNLRRPTASRLLSFGSGIHHCLGAALAKMEAPGRAGHAGAPVPRPRAPGHRSALERSHRAARCERSARSSWSPPA